VYTSEREEDLAHRLQRLVFRLNRELRVQSTAAGTSGADTLLLAEVRRRPGVGVSELSEHDNVARSVMSERVKRLEAAGLIARDGLLHDDKRRIGLTITEAGHRVLDSITEQRRAWMVGRLAGLSLDEREAVSRAVEALETLTDRGARRKNKDHTLRETTS
jgi:DNA-binding MarR family transcriptional regulator